MKIKCKDLESSGYRCLFEYIKQEGIEGMMAFIRDTYNIMYYTRKEVMFKQAIVYGKNDLLSLVKKNMDIVKYLREHEKDFRKFSFTSENILKILTSLSEDISCLELYLENAKKLENLEVARIRFKDFLNLDLYKCGFYQNSDGQIISIQKKYTDGQIKSVSEQIKSVKKERETNKMLHYSQIPYIVDNESTSFCLKVANIDHKMQYREIEIRDFGFAGDKLPTEEELSSYEIPKKLIKK